MSGLRDELAALADEWEAEATRADRSIEYMLAIAVAKNECAADLAALLDRFPPEGEGEALVEWGIERSLPQVRGGEPYIEWNGWQGHDGYRVEYTAESVWSHASGRPVWRRTRITTRDRLGEPERVTTNPALAAPVPRHTDEGAG